MIGQLISHYRIIEKLGAGGMGVVYRAEDLKLGREVALKFLPDDMARDRAAIERFEREARAAASINHPHICTVYEVGEHEGHPFLAMELLEGETLRQRMGGRSIPLVSLVDWAIQITEGLDAAHAGGIVHRDIKPANLFLTPKGHVKILDFGLAKPVTAGLRTVSGGTGGSDASTIDLMTTPGTAAGTPGYMSPEQARGDDIDARSDLFSLGVVLYEMAAGRLPFQGKTWGAVIAAILHEEPEMPSRLNGEIPRRLDEIIHRALEKDRDVRYQSAADLRADVKRLRRDLESGKSQASAGALRGAVAGRENGLRRWLLGGAAVALLAVAVVAWSTRPMPPPRVTSTVQLTADGANKSIFVTGNSRLYFLSGSLGSKARMYQMSVRGGDAVPMPNALAGMIPLDISADGSELLVAQLTGGGVPFQEPLPIWVVPTLADAPRRLGDLKALDARWSPGGDRIAYVSGWDLRLARSDGTDIGKLASTGGQLQQIRWSPDGTRLRFTSTVSNSSSIWEVSSNGAHLGPLFPDWKSAQQNAGNWTSDGKYYLFTAGRDRGDIWARRERTGFLDRGGPGLIQLTTGPMQSYLPEPSADGKRIFFLGGLLRGELVRYETKSGEWVSYLGGISAMNLSFSPDGKWLAYTSYPEGALWRSAVDGSQRLQLSSGPMQAGLIHWSADSKQIAFVSGAAGTPLRVHVVSADGGAARQITHGESGPRGDVDPSFSADGTSLIFSSLAPEDMLTPDKILLRSVNLKSGAIAVLPGSQGLWSARVSPDGRYLAAVSVPKWKLMLYDMEKHQQQELADINAGWPQWTRDGQSLYFTSMNDDPAFYRIRLRDRKVEKLASLKSLKLPAPAAWWSGVAPDGTLLSVRDTGTTEIYALDWEKP